MDGKEAEGMTLSGIFALALLLIGEWQLARYLHRREQRRNLRRHCAELAERDRRME
jgi:hypothetical protein